MTSPEFQSHSASNGQVHVDLKFPAIGLIVAGCANAVFAALLLLSGLLRIVGDSSSVTIDSDAQRAGYIAGTVVGYGAGLVSLLLSPVVIAGGVAMFRGRNVGLVRSAAWLSLIPLTSCCCVLGIPIGIWVLQILKRPDVVEHFQRQGRAGMGPMYR
jgi:hypothetical protein